MRSLAADGPRLTTGTMLVAALGLALWGGWFVLARVTVYEMSTSARLEVDQAAHKVRSPVAGEIVASQLILGEDVKAGDLLLELAAQEFEARLEGERSRVAALTRQREVIGQEVSAQGRASEHEHEASAAAEAEAAARWREADTRARAAEAEAKRLVQLWQEGQVSKAESERTRAKAEQERAAADAQRIAIRRSERNTESQDEVGRVKTAGLERELAAIEEQLAEARAAIKLLEQEIDRRSIRSPVDGRIGEVAMSQIGAFVDSGQELGAVIPQGELTVVADYPPHSALGRIRSGQTARVRLDGFPWAQYGTLSATVHRVAGEVRDGLVRVELHIESSSRLPLQHGLPGTVEIEVERVSPATLVLRAAGQLLASPVSESPRGG